jgi:hypothetical protein
MAYKAPKPTKAQLAEAKVRAAASGIAMNQSAKGLRNASKAIVAGASMLPAGRAVKVAATAAKAATKAGSAARANARGLKAANKPTKAAKSGEGNNKLISVEARRGALKNSPPARANRTRGGGLSTLKRQDAAAKADKSVSNLKNTKPMENVPKGVSDRFNATVKRLAAEEAAKKKK